MSDLEKVPFDPGFSKFATVFPREICDYMDEISLMKQNHQKKFAFARMENHVVSIINILASFYLGCIFWGGYLFWKYKDNIREIDGNPAFLLSDDEINNLKYDDEIDFIINFLDKFEKNSKYYLHRPSRINPEYIKYFKNYKQFASLNNNFKTLKYTNEIQLPDIIAHFENFSEEKLDELKQRIDEIINSDNIQDILSLKFYN